jgi:hypothetical protein
LAIVEEAKVASPLLYEIFIKDYNNLKID